MFISKTLDQSAGSLDQINCKKVFAELSELWILLWKILIISAILTYVSGKALGLWVHRTNDQLAANWVRILALTPVMEEEEEENEEDEVPLPTMPLTPSEVEQAPVITEEVSVPTPPTVEVEPPLPPVAEVVEIPVLDEQPPPPARRRRRSSAPRSLKETVTEEAEPATNPRPRGPKAHGKRVRRTLAA